MVSDELSVEKNEMLRLMNKYTHLRCGCKYQVIFLSDIHFQLSSSTIQMQPRQFICLH